MTPDLREALYGLVPADGTSIGNGSLRKALSARLGREVSEAEYFDAQQALVDAGRLVKGKGRGGSVARAAAGDAALSRTTQAVPEDAKRPKPKQAAMTLTEARRAKAEPTAGRKTADDATVLSYRHRATRKNNPEVGMVTPDTDADAGTTRWAYDPHLDPVLNFEVGRAQIEALVDDALASGDADTMGQALETLKRMAMPYLQWAGKAERTSFEVDTVSLQVHERIDPATILGVIRKRMKDVPAGAGQVDFFRAWFEEPLAWREAMMLKLSDLEPLPDTRHLHCTGTVAETGERVVVSFGPEHAALEQRQVELAMREAGDLFPRPKMILFCAFTFDPEAAKDIDATRGITALRVQMNTDLLTEDLKKARANNQSFWLMGQPDVELRRRKDGQWEVAVHGRDLVVINDEAHHAYRKPADLKISKKAAEERGIDLDEATRWIEGLDRIHKTRRLVRCFDLSATPFAPTGRTNTNEGLFDWIVSDFGLNDAIEAGLVKTPRVVVRDGALPNAATLKPRLYHLYREPEVGEDLNRKGALPTDPLPQLVQDADTLLGADWLAAVEKWRQEGHVSPPVMLTVCNRTETAARIEHYFNRGDAPWSELKAPSKTLRVDSKVLEKAEIGESAAADKVYEARLQQIVEASGLPTDRAEKLLAEKKEIVLRAIVDNVGKRGTAGQNLQKVISVAMLSEDWDAKNVTHILGLRACSSQLLCEQVIGRGLRRVRYDTEAVVGAESVERQLFLPEYVNVFGVPLSIFQDVGDGGEAPPPPKSSTQMESLAERGEFEIRWPNVLRVDPVVHPELVVPWSKVEVLKLEPQNTAITAEFAPALGGATDWSRIHTVDLAAIPEAFRLQRLIFLAARKAADQLRQRCSGSTDYLLTQLVRLVEQFLASDRLEIPGLFHQEPVRRRVLISLNLDRVVAHLLCYVDEQNMERIELIFDESAPIGSTRDMRTWYTTRPTIGTVKSQISHVVGDGTWEGHVCNVLESSPQVNACAKNDHIGFQIHYLWRGSRRRFVPDLLVRLANGVTLVLEIKGVDDDQNRAKRAALSAWVRGGESAWWFRTVGGRRPLRSSIGVGRHRPSCRRRGSAGRRARGARTTAVRWRTR